MIDRPSPNFDARPPGAIIDMLVMHYTGMESANAALDRLCDPAAKVSAHYLIDEDGTILRLVDEDQRAWHAGRAFWKGTTDLNGCAIGVELVNPGHEFGYRPFPDTQTAALIGLARDLTARHPIPARRVLGHSDIAPRRKQDPGELFDWARLAAAGIGLWPADAAPATPDTATADRLLAAFGYETEDLPATLTAFQRHFRPERIDGRLDPHTMGRLHALAAAVAVT